MSGDDIETALATVPEPDLTDPDNPEWTAEDFARAKRPEDLPAHLREAIYAAFPNTKRIGRPPAHPRKQAVNLRLDLEVLQYFKATGAGWQTRINAALREIVERNGKHGHP